MKTVAPTDGMQVAESVRFEPGVYFMPQGIDIVADGVAVEAAGVSFVGVERQGQGVRVHNASNVSISGLSLREYRHGIFAEDCRDVSISGCNIRCTAELAPNTLFLDIWLPVERAYGGAVLLNRCVGVELVENDFQHQQSGLLAYHCSSLKARKNECNYNSGFGIFLYGTTDSEFIENSCDYCCRFEVREGGLHYGHMGADAAGFVCVAGSSRNRFYRNTARLGGDGFFLAGRGPDIAAGCDDNVFEENDASLSPNIAFEATFCSGNVFINNFADRCNYGFWLGFSRNTKIEGNRMLFNRQAGIAVENGIELVVTGNHFQSNGHGILLWSHHVADFAQSHPDNDTSRDWQITGNRFYRNGVGIRIAADQDHGIRNLEAADAGDPSLWPHSHKILDNDIQDNRIGIELVRTRKNEIRGNLLSGNVEANIREVDCEENVIGHNLGRRGAYL